LDAVEYSYAVVVGVWKRFSVVSFLVVVNMHICKWLFVELWMLSVDVETSFYLFFVCIEFLRSSVNLSAFTCQRATLFQGI